MEFGQLSGPIVMNDGDDEDGLEKGFQADLQAERLAGDSLPNEDKRGAEVTWPLSEAVSGGRAARGVHIRMGSMSHQRSSCRVCRRSSSGPRHTYQQYHIVLHYVAPSPPFLVCIHAPPTV